MIQTDRIPIQTGNKIGGDGGQILVGKPLKIKKNTVEMRRPERKISAIVSRLASKKLAAMDLGWTRLTRLMVARRLLSSKCASTPKIHWSRHRDCQINRENRRADGQTSLCSRRITLTDLFSVHKFILIVLAIRAAPKLQTPAILPKK